MIDKDTALLVQQRSLAAVRELTSILHEIQDKCPEEDFNILKRGIGRTIGDIQMDILEYINKQYPEIDDLKD